MANISNKGKVISAHFIDINNRFVLILKPQESIIYDMVTGESMIMNDTLTCDIAVEQERDNWIWMLTN